MHFAGFEFDQVRGELTLHGERVPLQEQPLRLLKMLLDRQGQVLSRESIQAELWGQMYRDHEHGINTAVRKLRKVLELAKNSGLRIVTSAGRGYRLLLPAEDTQPHQPQFTGRQPALATVDTLGQEAFITGRFLFSQRDPGALFSAKAQFQLACERMPEFALAHACLSRTCRVLTILDFDTSDPRLLWDLAERHARRAVEIDHYSAEALSSLASVLARYRWQWKEGFAAYDRALELNPSDVETCCDYGIALLANGRYTDGVHVLDRILSLDPRDALGRATVALGRLMLGKTEEGMGMLTGMTQAMPSFLIAWLYLGIGYLDTERWSEALAAFDRVLTLAPDNPNFLGLLAHIYAGQEQRNEVAEIAKRLSVLSQKRYVSPTSRLFAAMACGEVRIALQELRNVVVERDPNFALYRRMHFLDPIRQSQAFRAAIKAMDLLEEPI